MGPFLLLAGTFLLMWVLFILPQQRWIRAHREVVASLEVGDEVMTTAGMYGTITAIDADDDVVQLEIAPGTVVRLARGAIAQRVGLEPEPEDTPARPSGTAADRAVEPIDRPAEERRVASTAGSPRRKVWSLVFIVGLAAAALSYVLIRGWSPQLGL